MREEWGSALLLVVLLGSSAVGMAVRPYLSERHWNRETAALVNLVTVMLVTFAALVLGLLTSSAKTAFDTVAVDLRGFSVELIEFDQAMREYGPETIAARQLLRSYTAAVIASTWRHEPPPPGDYYPRQLPHSRLDTRMESVALGDTLTLVELELRRLKPADPVHQQLSAEALRRFDQVVDSRWRLIEESQRSISSPFYAVLGFWLAVVFAVFGLSAPRNPVTYAIIALAALSIASVVFVMLDLDAPFGGLFGVSSAPMREALAHLSR
jgi:hypothetical protein